MIHYTGESPFNLPEGIAELLNVDDVAWDKDANQLCITKGARRATIELRDICMQRSTPGGHLRLLIRAARQVGGEAGATTGAS